MDRLKLAVGIALGVLMSSPRTEAAYTVPAVNLPAQTPDAVRDRVARSLALGRDQVGRALYPFRGEFHGLGQAAGGGSQAIALSGDGRVVVGYEWTGALGGQPFVWSPATGRAPYNMLPNGASGSPFISTLSADGVYVGGNATFVSRFGIFSWSSNSGMLWSLAGNRTIDPTWGSNLHVASLSADGKVAVGTQSWFGSGYSSIGGYKSNELLAYRYTRNGSVQEIGRLATEGDGYYVDSMAIDVTADGDTVLVNGLNHRFDARTEPYLWEADGRLRPLGQAMVTTYQGQTPRVHTLQTQGEAISADGSTVVGWARATPWDSYNLGLQGTWPVLWREETGWIDLGELKSSTNHRPIVGYEATGVSGDGSVVIGHAKLEQFICDCQYTPSYNIPFHWDEARGMRDLGDVLRYDYGLDLADWSFYDVAGISDDGTTIIGNGLSPDRKYEAWRAVMHRNTPLGDIDFDGDIDPQDYAQLTSNLGASSNDGAVFYADGDLNADGRVDQSDAATLLGLYQGRRQGDFNADGVVNIADYTLWRDHVGKYTGGLADSNGDGWVNQADLAVWRTHFGRALGSLFPFSIPEPTTATLFAIAFLGVSRRR